MEPYSVCLGALGDLYIFETVFLAKALTLLETFFSIVTLKSGRRDEIN